VLLWGAAGSVAAALYLAAAASGTLGTSTSTWSTRPPAASDLHGTSQSACRSSSPHGTIHDLNPNVRVTFNTHSETRSTSSGVRHRGGRPDNFPTRYLVNDACVAARQTKRLRLDFPLRGQASVFHAKRGHAIAVSTRSRHHRDWFHRVRGRRARRCCRGSSGRSKRWQTIKLILGVGQPLIGRLVLFAALKLEFRS